MCAKKKQFKNYMKQIFAFCLSKLLNWITSNQTEWKVNCVTVSSFSFPCWMHIVGGSSWASIEDFPAILLV